LASTYPNITDGIVLTGFSMNGSFVSSFAAGGNFQQASPNQPLRFNNYTGMQVQNLLTMYAEPLVDYIIPVDLSLVPSPQAVPNGYIISSDVEANQYLCFKPHYYDPATLTLAEKTKHPVTEGELLTLASVLMMNGFAGPVMVISGGQLDTFGLSRLMLTVMQIPISPTVEATVFLPVVSQHRFLRWSR
jgi:hypothetical protein